MMRQIYRKDNSSTAESAFKAALQTSGIVPTSYCLHNLDFSYTKSNIVYCRVIFSILLAFNTEIE